MNCVHICWDIFSSIQSTRKVSKCHESCIFFTIFRESNDSYSSDLFASWLYTHGHKFIELFSVSCKIDNTWRFLEFLDLELKPCYVSLNIWNVIYFDPAVTVQCPETISNLSHFRCLPRSRVGKMWKWTNSTIYSISNTADIFVLKYMKYHTRLRSCHGRLSALKKFTVSNSA